MRTACSVTRLARRFPFASIVLHAGTHMCECECAHLGLSLPVLFFHSQGGASCRPSAREAITLAC
jgi:hypothetical protein